MNEQRTRFVVSYRDASNYRQDETVIVDGPPDPGIIRRIIAACDDQGEAFFIPFDVGLPIAPQLAFTGYLNDDDHCWCTLDPNGFTATTEDATVDTDLVTLAARFEQAAAAGWPGQHTDLADLLDAEAGHYDDDGRFCAPDGTVIAA